LPSEVGSYSFKTPMKGDEIDNSISKPLKKENKVEILEKNIEPDLKFKIILVGNMSVGKSCLTLRATEGIFKESLESTVHLSICTFNVKINDFYEFPIDNGPSFYLTQGKHIMTVTNEEAVFNLDCFMMQKSSVTDNEVAQVKTTPSKVVLMQGEYADVYPRAYNKSGEMIAAPVTWSSNVKDGRYTAGSYGTDEIVLTMGSISKTIKVDIAKPTKKKEFFVSKYGSLRTDKGYVADASGNKVCLMGPSLFWSCSAPLWWNKETVNFLVEKYNIQVIRLPVAIAPCGS